MDIQRIKEEQFNAELARDPKQWELLHLLQDYYDTHDLQDIYKDKVLSENLCHYDDVDQIDELAFQMWLEE